MKAWITFFSFEKLRQGLTLVLTLSKKLNKIVFHNIACIFMIFEGEDEKHIFGMCLSVNHWGLVFFGDLTA